MIRRFIREIRTQKAIRMLFKDKNNLARLNELNFDIDWIGRIYGVVPVDPEVLNLPERDIQEQYEKGRAIDIYIKDKLVAVVRFLEELQIAHLLLFPDQYERFEGTNDFLVVFQPEHKLYSVPKMIGLGCTLLGLGVLAAILLAVI